MSDEKTNSEEIQQGPPVNISISTKNDNDEERVMKCVHLLEELLLQARKGAFREFVFVATARTPNSLELAVRHTPLDDEFRVMGQLDCAKAFVSRTLKNITPKG